MHHLTNTIAKADPQRLSRAAYGLARAAAGLGDALTVKVLQQDAEEVLALVVNGDNQDYTVSINGQTAYCACKDWRYRKEQINGICKHIAAVALHAIKHPDEGVAKEQCKVCETPLAADQGFHLEDGNDGRIVESGPYCEPCGQAKLIEVKSALESAANTPQSRTSAIG